MWFVFVCLCLHFSLYKMDTMAIGKGRRKRSSSSLCNPNLDQAPHTWYLYMRNIGRALCVCAMVQDKAPSLLIAVPIHLFLHLLFLHLLFLKLRQVMRLMPLIFGPDRI